MDSFNKTIHHNKSSIPILLYHREVHNLFQSKILTFRKWKSNLLFEDEHQYQLPKNENDTKKAKEEGHSNLPMTLSSTTLSNLMHANHRPKRFLWKKSFRRSIPFSNLETPFSDAILSIDSTGSFMVSLGERHGNKDMLLDMFLPWYYQNIQPYIANDDLNRSEINRDEGGRKRVRLNAEENSIHLYYDMIKSSKIHIGWYPSLSIRFYAIPSPAKLSSKNKSRFEKEKVHVDKSPLIATVPLLWKTNNIFRSNMNRYNHEEDQQESASNRPIHILLSDDSKIGVAFIHAPINKNEEDEIEDEENLGSFVIFLQPLVHPIQRTIKAYSCSNVYIRNRNTKIFQNLFWHTRIIPLVLDEGKDHKGIQKYFRRSKDAYIILNDEQDGFRILWLEFISPYSVNSNNPDQLKYECHKSNQTIHPNRKDIIFPYDENCLDTFFYDMYSGLVFNNIHKEDGTGFSLSVCYGAYLHVDALLDDILHRRLNLFASKNGKIKLPNFYYDIISVDYETNVTSLVLAFENPRFLEESWVKDNKHAAAFALFLKIDLMDQSYTEGEWLQNRLYHHPEFLKKWIEKLVLRQRMNDMNLEHFDSDFSLLYPFCDVVTNQAVISCQPVSHLESKNYPMSFVYS